MQILSSALSDEVSLLVIDDGAGWRFSHWVRRRDDAILPQPTEDVLALRFTTADAAVSCFRSFESAPPTVRQTIVREHARAVRESCSPG